MPCSFSKLVDVLGQPLACGIVAEVEQAALGAAEHPFRMIVRQPRVGSHPFRLEPDQDLQTLAVGVIRDRPQSPRETDSCPLPTCRRAASRRRDAHTSRHPSTSNRA